MNIELEQQWKKMGTAEDTHSTINFFIPRNADLRKTASPLYKIKKGLETGMCWAVVIVLMYIVGIAFFKPLITKFCVLILAGYSIYTFMETLKLHQRLDPMVMAGNSVKAELERHYNSIKQWCKTQERNAIFLYPVSLLGGAMLGLSADGMDKMDRVLQKPVVWILLAVIVIVMVPVLYYLTRWMMKLAYYKHLEHLRQLINALEE